MSKPIRISSITDRKISMSIPSEPKINHGMCNYVWSVMNYAVVTELANNISSNVADCNKYWKTVIELVEKLDEKENKSHHQIHSILEYQILPKLTKENTKSAISRIKESKDEYLDITRCVNILEDALVMERVITNHKALSKRFDFDKIARESVRKRKVQDGIQEMCELIETYDISPQAKFNIALENITYALGCAGYTGSVVEEVIDYFLLNNPVITDFTYETVQNLVKESRMISDEDKQKVIYFTESKSDRYTTKVNDLAGMCKSNDAASLISTAVNIKTEKDAASYINRAVGMASNSEDSKYLVSSVFAIPLMGKVSKPFVTYQYKLAADKVKLNKKLEKNFSKKIQAIIDDDDETLMVEASLLDQDPEEFVAPVLEYGNFENTAILESEDFGESDDIKDLLNDFKKEQKKDMGKFKYYLSKIYRKSPESIIDETLNIFGVVRAAFILAPIGVPVIGPVLSLITAFVDKILSMHINDKETRKLIKKLESELDKVDKEIEKKPDKKAELEKYKKCIEACIKKVDAYREANISSEEIEDRRGKSVSDDELDFDFGELDFELESVLMVTEAMNIILSAQQNNLNRRICGLYEQDMTTEEFAALSEVVGSCSRVIKFDDVAETARYHCKLYKPLNESVYMETLLANTAVHIPQNCINDIIYEAIIVEGLEEILTEGFNLNKLKLLMQVAKGKAKDLSTKEKAFWKNMDILASGFMKNVERALTSDRREGIIKGSLIPSFSKCIKSAMLVGGISFINPILGIITAMGMIGTSKALNQRERNLIYDEIETELKVIEKEIEIANNDGNMKKYRVLLQYQKRLERERQRIKYGIKVKGRDLPNAQYSTGKRGDDY